MLTLAPRPEPTIEVDRRWLVDMLASLNDGELEDVRAILEAAIRIFDREKRSEE